MEKFILDEKSFFYINSIKEFGKGGYQEFFSIYQNSSIPSEFLI